MTTFIAAHTQLNTPNRKCFRFSRVMRVGFPGSQAVVKVPGIGHLRVLEWPCAAAAAIPAPPCG